MHKCYKTPHIYFLDSDRTANVYFTSDVGAKNRIRSLNEFSKINLTSDVDANTNTVWLYIICIILLANQVTYNYHCCHYYYNVTYTHIYMCVCVKIV